MAIFTQLALSHVYDLFLNKLPADPLTFACFKYGAVFTQYHVPRSRTMEDRRTVLACWFITSQFVDPVRVPPFTPSLIPRLASPSRSRRWMACDGHRT